MLNCARSALAALKFSMALKTIAAKEVRSESEPRKYSTILQPRSAVGACSKSCIRKIATNEIYMAVLETINQGTQNVQKGVGVRTAV